MGGSHASYKKYQMNNRKPLNRVPVLNELLWLCRRMDGELNSASGRP
jgi:hypothetical protein